MLLAAGNGAILDRLTIEQTITYAAHARSAWVEQQIDLGWLKRV